MHAKRGLDRSDRPGASERAGLADERRLERAAASISMADHHAGAFHSERRALQQPHGGLAASAVAQALAGRRAREQARHARVVAIADSDALGRQRAEDRRLLLLHAFDRTQPIQVRGRDQGQDTDVLLRDAA